MQYRNFTNDIYEVDDMICLNHGHYILDSNKFLHIRDDIGHMSMSYDIN
jgi:hypothetical protein